MSCLYALHNKKKKRGTEYGFVEDYVNNKPHKLF